MTLKDVKEKQVVLIKQLAGGFGQRRKLLGLGIYPGEAVRVLHNSAFGGPILIEVRGNEVAIGKTVAADVEVEDLPK
jgi:Fe2+ transport system protein FeoA